MMKGRGQWTVLTVLGTLHPILLSNFLLCGNWPSQAVQSVEGEVGPAVYQQLALSQHSVKF